MKLTKEVIRNFPIPNDNDGGYVLVKHLEDDEVFQIEHSTTSYIQTASGQEFSLDIVAREAKMCEAALTGWGNLFGVDGRELEFNIVNVKTARRFSILSEDGKKKRFFEWIQECRKVLADEVKEEGKAAKGN